MKYILKKEYPGSPKLGNIIDNLENDWIENYPEFWEKTVEKDYEILKLSLQRSIKHQIVSALENSEDYTISLLNCNGNKIHSVKRLSDGEIFTIGDKTNFGLISKIVINNNSLSFYFEQKSCGYNLQTLIKWKPLFTTEDGVDIFEGDYSYGVHNSKFDIVKIKHINTVYVGDNFIEFSTKEKAEEYILMNKPVLSLNDVASIYPGINISLPDLPLSLSERLKNLVKSKIQQSV